MKGPKFLLLKILFCIFLVSALTFANKWSNGVFYAMCEEGDPVTGGIGSNRGTISDSGNNNYKEDYEVGGVSERALYGGYNDFLSYYNTYFGPHLNGYVYLLLNQVRTPLSSYSTALQQHSAYVPVARVTATAGFVSSPQVSTPPAASTSTSAPAPPPPPPVDNSASFSGEDLPITGQPATPDEQHISTVSPSLALPSSSLPPPDSVIAEPEETLRLLSEVDDSLSFRYTHFDGDVHNDDSDNSSYDTNNILPGAGGAAPIGFWFESPHRNLQYSSAQIDNTAFLHRSVEPEEEEEKTSQERRNPQKRSNQKGKEESYEETMGEEKRELFIGGIDPRTGKPSNIQRGGRVQRVRERIDMVLPRPASSEFRNSVGGRSGLLAGRRTSEEGESDLGAPQEKNNQKVEEDNYEESLGVEKRKLFIGGIDPRTGEPSDIQRGGRIQRVRERIDLVLPRPAAAEFSGSVGGRSGLLAAETRRVSEEGESGLGAAQKKNQEVEEDSYEESYEESLGGERRKLFIGGIDPRTGEPSNIQRGGRIQRVRERIDLVLPRPAAAEFSGSVGGRSRLLAAETRRVSEEGESDLGAPQKKINQNVEEDNYKESLGVGKRKLFIGGIDPRTGEPSDIQRGGRIQRVRERIDLVLPRPAAAEFSGSVGGRSGLLAAETRRVSEEGESGNGAPQEKNNQEVEEDSYEESLGGERRKLFIGGIDPRTGEPSDIQRGGRIQRVRERIDLVLQRPAASEFSGSVGGRSGLLAAETRRMPRRTRSALGGAGRKGLRKVGTGAGGGIRSGGAFGERF